MTGGGSTLLSVLVVRSAQFSFGAWLRSVSVAPVPASQFRRGRRRRRSRIAVARAKGDSLPVLVEAVA